MHDNYRGWILGFLKFIKPRRHSQAIAKDVEEFLAKLGAEEKKDWQLRQAEEALRIFFTEVEPLNWAAHWPEGIERICGRIRATDAVRPPTRGPATGELLKRSDSGDLPARYAGFLDVVRETLRMERYAYRTEQTYLDWVRRFLIFAFPKSRREIEATHVREYLEYLTLVRRVSASTQNQALNALQFLFTKVLKRKIGMLDELARAPQSRRLPTVLSRTEVRALLDVMDGTGRLMADLMYGAGLRVTECARLRIKDVDFGNGYLVVRGGKGDKDRFAPLPESLKDALRAQIEVARERWWKDRAMGVEGVFLPEALSGQVCQRRQRLEMVLALSLARSLGGPMDEENPAASFECKRRATACEARGDASEDHQAGYAAHAQAFVCYAFARGGRRHTHRARAARTFGCKHHDDLHACAWASKRGGEVAAR
jgi:site-specific recombinase XerD